MIKKNKGLTLIEVMISVTILGIISVGAIKLYSQGLEMWNYGTAKMALAGEARIIMTTLTKFIHACQGTTVKISRFNNNQPTNSYISGKLLETVFVTTTRGRCCGNAETKNMTVGGAGEDVQIFQNNNYLLSVRPYLLPGTDITDPSEVKNNTRYKTITLTANVESIMFVYDDSQKSDTIVVSVRLSNKPLFNKPPIKINLKKSVVIKHMHSAGYYGN